MDDLIDVMRTLRGPNGCLWDKKQTIETLMPCMIEEVHEIVDGVAAGENEKFQEEMGDLLCVFAMLIVIAEEQNIFSKEDIMQSAAGKMKRRHPHVFDAQNVSSAEEAHALWHKQKEKEKSIKERESALDDISESYPALTRADKIQRRVARVGFDWPDLVGVIDKIDEELRELKIEIQKGETNRDRIQEELGDVLFSVCNVARKLKIDSEFALHKTNFKFMKRFKNMEKLIRAKGKEIKDMPLEEMDEYWEQVKADMK